MFKYLFLLVLPVILIITKTVDCSPDQGKWNFVMTQVWKKKKLKVYRLKIYFALKIQFYFISPLIKQEHQIEQVTKSLFAGSQIFVLSK